MKKELEQKIFEKCPDLFRIRDEELSDNERRPRHCITLFGFEHGDGWYYILYSLCTEIQQYIDNKRKYSVYKIKNKFIRKFVKKYKNKFKWKSPAEKFIRWIDKISPKQMIPPPEVHVTQIKEKFGGLCFYYEGGNDYIEGLIGLAERMCYSTCEYCGTTENVGHTQGWISTICESCKEKEDNRKDLEWKPLRD